MNSEEMNPFAISRSAKTWLLSGAEIEEDEATSSEWLISEEREGTIWGGEVGGDNNDVASGATGWGICRRMAKKGDAGSNKGLKRGITKSR